MITYTKKQARVMRLIADFRAEHGVSPTLKEIAEGIGKTKPTAYGHITSLIRKKAVRKEPSEARSIQILDPEYLPGAGMNKVAIDRDVLDLLVEMADWAIQDGFVCSDERLAALRGELVKLGLKRMSA